MATAGGVVFKEIQAITLQSRLVSGLFFAGELLDYALPTGGYNIQIAFSTGSLAGYSARSL
jgi:predicted flavoprotein YhiN